MEQEFRDKIVPADLCWAILNNLQEFNSKPEMVFAINNRISKLSDHPLMGVFAGFFDRVVCKYEELDKFPDMEWLQLNYRGSSLIKVVDFKYSSVIYDDLINYLDKEILVKNITNKIVNSGSPTVDTFRELSKEMSTFAESSVKIQPLSKKDLLNLYDSYKENYKGVMTYIPQIDDNIGPLGNRSLATIVAPSGSGKSTVAVTAAYNAAVHGGLCVDYLSFEIPEDQMWFNISSIESHVLGHDIEATLIKEARLTEEQVIKQKQCMESILSKLNKSGGYINVIDQTRAHIDTFEGLCNKLEAIAEERGRPADLIIVDNVDNLRILKSSEKDETTRVNTFIIKLDAYSKTYYNNTGTVIALLSQTSRAGLKKFQDVERGEEKVAIDYTVAQKYNSLYERSTTMFSVYSDPKLRSLNRMNIYPIKLRNRPVPLGAIKVPAQFAFSHVGGILEEPNLDEIESMTEQDLNDSLMNICDD